MFKRKNIKFIICFFWLSIILTSCAQLTPLSKEKIKNELIDSKISNVGTVITLYDKYKINIIIQNLIGDNKLLNQILRYKTIKIDIIINTIIDSSYYNNVKLRDNDRIIIYQKDEYERIIGYEFNFKNESINADLDFVNLIINNTLFEYTSNKELNNSVENKPEKKGIKRKDYALIFATNTYDNWNNLDNPIFDGKKINKELSKLYDFETELIENPTLEQITKKLMEYVEKEYNENDQIFIFFAGHGDFNETFKEGYLVAKDSKFKDKTGITYYSYNRLSSNIDVIPCKHILITFDVCFGGTIDEFIAKKTRGTEELYKIVDNKEFIERCFQYKTRKYLASSKKGYVYDGIPNMHSPFSAYLIEALRTCGGNDGVLEFNEIIKVIARLKPEPAWGSLKNDEPGSNFIFIAK